MKELSAREDTITSLGAMSQALRKRATALSELADALGNDSSPQSLTKAGLVAGAQSRELKSLANHLRVVETYLIDKE